jgi:phage/plasmid-like protein (TIGR03299 family)
MDNLAEKTFELLEATGLNWRVNKMPLVTLEGGHPTESFAIIRNDNHQWLGTVGKVYEPLQNAKMAEILLEAADGLNLPVERGGLLNGGKKVYLQIGLPDDFVGKSEVKRWITGLNHHNSDGSIGFGSTNTVVVCRNTFAKAFGDMLKFRHTTSAKERIEIAMKSLRHALGLEEKQIDNFKIMAQTSLSDAIFSKVIKACFNVGLENKVGDTTTVQRNKLIQVNNAIEKELELEGATLWGLFNGITRYTNHVAPTKDRASYLMTGAGYDTNALAYDEIMKWVEARTAPRGELIQAP